MSDNNTNASISAENISLDNRHMFLTKEQVAKLDQLPTSAELEANVSDIYDNLKAYFNDLYIQLINIPDAVAKLKAVSTLLQTDDTLNSVMNMIANKADKEDLAFHTNNHSHNHLTSDDRVGLYMLTQMIKDGGIDWNAEVTSLGYIKNKPTSMVADGGDADTVSGYTVDKLITKKIYNTYVGCGLSVNEKTAVDIYLDPDETYDFICNYGTTYFYNGVYHFNILNFNSTASIIGGGYDFTTFVFDDTTEINLPKNTSIKDITIKNAAIYVGDYNVINRVRFVNCKIYMNSVTDSRVEDCNFDNCSFMFSGACYGNIITNNISNVSMPIIYIGGDNVVANNVRC